MCGSDSKRIFANSIKEGSIREVELELDLEQGVGFKFNGCNSTSHGKKVEMEEHDTRTVIKHIYLV